MTSPHDGRQARRRVVQRRWTVAAVVSLALIAVAAGVLTRTPRHSNNTVVATRATTPASPSRTSPRRFKHAGVTSTVTHSQTAAAHRKRRGRPTTPTAAGCSLHLASARHVADAEGARYRIGFALMTSAGRTLAAVAPTTENYGGSITKSMLLVAFLRDWAADGLSAAARQEMAAMIEVSDNTAADWVYAHLKTPSADVERVATDAGMTGFHLDTSDPVYVLGQSRLTAGDFARFFSRIETLMPASERQYGMGLLASVQERVGLLAAGLPGVVYSKEGWKPENAGMRGAPYIVNQAGQFSCAGVTYGIAITVGQAPDQDTAQSAVQRIASALTHPSS